ncbi:MAG: RNA polymerase sigma factor [Silvanigrellaceae bacterium]
MNPSTTPNDREWQNAQLLFMAYLSGDASVVNQLFTLLGRAVRGFFFARTRSQDDSDDLTQATLLKIHLARHSFDSRLSLKTWMFTIAHRTLIDHWRKRGRRDATETQEDSGILSDYSDPETIELSTLVALRGVLEKALESLKPSDRSIVYLGVVEGLSMSELAVVVNSTEGAVKVKLHRLLRNLRGSLREMEAQGDSP